MSRILLGVCLACLLPGFPVHAAEPPAVAWPQFRGPGGRAVNAEEKPLPVRFGPSSNVLWKTPLPAGLSSPCIWGDRIFVTGFTKENQKLETFCIDRATGRILWRKTAPAEKVEKFFTANSPATPTPATDGTAVYVYFGSYGLLAYDQGGQELWKKPLPTPTTSFGTGSSPVLSGQVLLQTCPGKDSCLLAVDCRTGATLWKKERPRFGIGYAAPFVRQGEDGPEVLLASGRGLIAFDLKDGAERWWTAGFFGGGIPTPAEGDGLLFVVAHFPGGDPDDRMKLPPFDDLLKKYDKNKDGLLGRDEVPMDLILYDRGGHDVDSSITMEDMFPSADKNGDGKIDRQEWEELGKSLAKRESSLFALRPGRRGELPPDQVIWKERRALPEVPSPLFYQGRLYLVKDGGIASCFDAKSGRLIYRERLGPSGFYYSSPVAGDGKIYAASLKGVITVFQAGDRCQVLAENDLKEPIAATPALADGKLYVRTDGHLYAFGKP
jgi:outer membrane protein assembly factor BamB